MKYSLISEHKLTASAPLTELMSVFHYNQFSNKKNIIVAKICFDCSVLLFSDFGFCC